MSWFAVGAAAVTVVGGAISSNNAAKKAENSEKRNLAFAEAQYQDWLDAFGSVQDNLSDYYNSLTPEFFEARNLEAFEKEKTRAMDNLRIGLEQRGIATSGLAADAEADIEFASASERAKIRAEAPMRVAQEQLGFLQTGLGVNPASSVQQVLSNQSVRTAKQADAARAEAADAASAAVDTTFDVLSKKFGSTPPTTGG